MGKPGYSTPEYKAAAKRFRTGLYPCHLRYPGCTGAGLTVDHSPALSTARTPEEWQGHFLPACKHCQDVQGANIRNGRTTHTWRW